MSELTPREIVSELDRHIVGQHDAKRAVAIALRNRWRRLQLDGVLRRLEAMLAVADATTSLIITGNGDVLEPENGIIAIGSGGPYAQAAAKALLDHSELSARDIVKKSLEIAGDMCIYTNHNRIIETIE